ncbi:MAG: cytidine deaminase [Methylovirgula sp.]
MDAIDRLFEAATAARRNAYAPYSGFAVGAALLTASGAIFAGANVENAAYPVGLCAEAAAIAGMIAAGERQIAEILILAESAEPIMPCGACRQRLFEFATKEMKVHSARPAGVALSLRLAELFPHAFGPGSLGVS